MKEQVKFLDTDFLDNKIEIGDKVIFETPKYRDFAIGTVITKAPKSCQIEYLSFAGGCKGRIDVVRQSYGQVIKYPFIKKGKWIERIEKPTWLEDDVEVYYDCSCCGTHNFDTTPYCPVCGAKMSFEETV